MDIQRAFKAPFVDVKWYVKTAWAGLWAGLIVTAPAVTGYTLDYIRNVAYGYETPLPEWNQGFSRWWMRGFLAGIAAFIYMLPAFVLLLIGAVPMIGALATPDYYGYGEAARATALLGSGSLCLTGFLAAVYIIAMSVFLQAAYVNFAFFDDFGALFRVKEIRARLRPHSADYFTAWGMSIVFGVAASAIASIVGSILGATAVLTPLAGFVGGAIGFVSTLMGAHLLGQYAARAYGLPGLAPLPVAPAGYTAAGYGYPAPPTGHAPQPYPPQAPYPAAPQPRADYPPAAPQPVTYAPPAAPAGPPAPMPPGASAAPAPVAEPPAAPEAPNPASTANSAPGSPMPPYSPEQAAPPSGPQADPPAEDGGA